MAMMPALFSFMRVRRRDPYADMLTWSSWLAEVGMLSTLAGVASCLFLAGQSRGRTVGQHETGIEARVRHQERRKTAQLAGNQRRYAPFRQRSGLADGQRQDIGGERRGLTVKIAAGHHRRLLFEHQRFSVTALASINSVLWTLSTRSRQAPITWGWQRNE